MKLLSLPQQFRNAQYARDFEKVTSIGQKIVARPRGNENILRSMARMQTELGLHDEAQSTWRVLAESNNCDLEAWFHYARYAETVAKKTQTEANHPLHLPTHKKLLEIIQDTLHHPLVDSMRPISKIVQICGVSFCGSTLLDRVLGSLPKCRSIGESHWLVKSYVDKRAMPIDFAKDTSRGIPNCSVCGPRCEPLSLRFRAQLSADHSMWYQKIAGRLDTDILIAADKNAQKLTENDPLLRMDCLVLFKSPLQAWYSQRNKLPKAQSAEYYEKELQRYLKVWANSYSVFLDDLKPQGKKVFVNFDRFADSPAFEFERLTNLLGLPQDHSVLSKAKQGHAIGGNSRAMRKIRDADYGVQITPLSEPELPNKELWFIRNSKDVISIFERLMDKYT